MKDNKSTFWTHTFKAYNFFHRKVKPRNQYEMLAEPVFYNDKFKVGNSCIKHRKLIENGFYSIEHFLKDNCEFKTHLLRILLLE